MRKLYLLENIFDVFSGWKPRLWLWDSKFIIFQTITCGLCFIQFYRVLQFTYKMKGFKLYLLWFLRFLMSFNMNTYQPWKVWRKAQKDISFLFDLNWSLLYHKLQLLNTTNFVCVTKFFNKIVVKSSVESLCLFLCFLLQPLFYGQCLVFPGVISILQK